MHVSSFHHVSCRGTRAVGVEFLPNPRFYPDAPQKATIARAKRLVVLSGGSFGSPAILERSGIGAAKVFSAHRIKQIVDLPGVGENYHGKQLTMYVIASLS